MNRDAGDKEKKKKNLKEMDLHGFIIRPTAQIQIINTTEDQGVP
jgi:hypothetical protein